MHEADCFCPRDPTLSACINWLSVPCIKYIMYRYAYTRAYSPDCDFIRYYLSRRNLNLTDYVMDLPSSWVMAGFYRKSSLPGCYLHMSPRRGVWSPQLGTLSMLHAVSPEVASLTPRTSSIATSCKFPPSYFGDIWVDTCFYLYHRHPSPILRPTSQLSGQQGIPCSSAGNTYADNRSTARHIYTTIDSILVVTRNMQEIPPNIFNLWTHRWS